MLNKNMDDEAKKLELTRRQKISLAWDILTLAFYCFYCMYFIFNGLGNKIVNVVLLSITVLYTLLFVGLWCVMGRKGKRYFGASKRMYKIMRKFTLTTNTIITGGAIINMGAFGNSLIVSVLAVVMIINLVLNILWLLLMKKAERKLQTLKTNVRKLKEDVASRFKKKDEKDRLNETDEEQ